METSAERTILYGFREAVEALEADGYDVSFAGRHYHPDGPVMVYTPLTSPDTALITTVPYRDGGLTVDLSSVSDPVAYAHRAGA